MRQFISPHATRSSATFGLWALALASLTFWGLRLSSPAGGAPYPPVGASSAAAPDGDALARALGVLPDAVAPVVEQAAAGRFALMGVLAGRSHAGTALLSVDGQPARPFRVGSTVAPGYVLRSVGPRRAVLGAEQAAASSEGLTVDMPAPVGATPAVR